jgi:hypothetical protein
MSTYKHMLDKATNRYQELIVEKNWLHKQKQASLFQAQGGPGATITDTDTQRKHIDCTPPKAGETTTRKTLDGCWNEYWCGNCRAGGRWGNHRTTDHDFWVDKMKDCNEQSKARKAAQQAAINSTVHNPPTSTNESEPTDDSASNSGPNRLPPAGRATYTVASSMHRIGTYGSYSSANL